MHSVLAIGICTASEKTLKMVITHGSKYQTATLLMHILAVVGITLLLTGNNSPQLLLHIPRCHG